jgi:lipid A 3-O-deacylase
MHRERIILILAIFLFASTVQAQLIDPAATFNTISGDHYFRFGYDNDYFTKMDYYYTQGINLEYVHSALRKFPLTKLLVKLPVSTYKYGVTLDHAAYTPTSIAADHILYGDRPYSASLTFKTFTISTDAIRKQHLCTSLVLGILGQSAFGQEMQTGIHKWTDNPLPMGWQFQIKNDVILNYQVNYEKRIWNPGSALQIGAAAEARLGTFQQKLATGFTIMAGHFNDPYQYNLHRHAGKKLQYYFFGHPFVNLVGYDGTLQGGLFNRKNPYTISAGDISRIVLQGDAGITVSTRKIYLSYCQSVMTKEFSTGVYHRWGEIRLGIGL